MIVTMPTAVGANNYMQKPMFEVDIWTVTLSVAVIITWVLSAVYCNIVRLLTLTVMVSELIIKPCVCVYLKVWESVNLPKE